MGPWDSHLARKITLKLPNEIGTTHGRTHGQTDRRTDGQSNTTVTSWLDLLVESVIREKSKKDIDACQLPKKRVADHISVYKNKLPRRSYRSDFKAMIISRYEEGMSVSELCNKYKSFYLNKTKK